MAVIFNESFETDGNGTRYTTSIPEFSDGAGDFFTRTDGSNITGAYDVAGADGTFYFGAQDVDGEGADSQQTLDFTGIDIAGFENLSFSVLVAEDDDGANQDWDLPDFAKIEFQIDGGGFQNLLAWESVPDGDSFNAVPAQDTDFDGDGDGTELTDTFTSFSAAIAGTGALLDLRFTIDLNSGDEDIAFDNIVVEGDPSGPTGPTETVVLMEDFNTDGNGSRYATSIAEFTDGAGDFFIRTDGADIGSFYDVSGFDGAYFAAMDLDGEGGPTDVEINFTGLDISGLTNLTFSGLFAEDDDGSNQDWDADSSVSIQYSIDGGAFETIIAFEAELGSDGNETNEVPRLDTDFDGVGDGTELTDAAQEFTAAIAGTGSSLDLKVVISGLGAGDEDIAFDDFKIVGQSGGVEPTTTYSVAADALEVTEGDTGSTPVSFTVTRSGDVSAASTITLTPGGTISADDVGLATLDPVSLSFGAGETSAVFTTSVIGDTMVEAHEAFTVTISDASDGGTITGASATTTILNDDITITAIHEIQGTVDQNLLDGMIVTVEAVVVGDFQDGDADTGRDLRGFYIQEESADEDSDPLTSEGIFVFDDSFGVDVNVGDVVQVTGTVDEFFGETQLDTITNVTVISTGGDVDSLVSRAVIDLPSAGTITDGAGDVAPDLEAYEGMLVEFADTLTITEMFQLDRFNEIKLTQGERPQQFTQFNDPDAAAFEAYKQEIGSRTITYDDGLNQQNQDIGNLVGFEGFSTANAPSMGDTIDNLTGVLSYQWAGNSASQATWRVRATEDGENSFDDTNPREAAPKDVGSDYKVASLNVLNFFTTLDEFPSVGEGSGPNGLSPRGADANPQSAIGTPAFDAEYQRQLDKLVTTLVAMDSDVVGLVELENDFATGGDAPTGTGNVIGTGVAIEELVAALNTALGSDIYDWVRPAGQTGTTSEFVGGDAIAVGFIYNTTTTSLVGESAVLDTDAFLDPNGTGEGKNRAALAQTFEEIDSGEQFTAAVNHFKSKGPSGLTAGDTTNLDSDQGDGQGFWNDTRTKAAQELDRWLATDPTGAGDPDVVILGDLNAYAKEDPIKALQAAGYTDLAAEFIGDDAYSFVFDGLTGTLDYAMANETMLAQVTGVTEWHINSDEADALDYNLDFSRDPAIFDGSVPFRSSDHDPVIVGLDLQSEPDTVVARLEFDDGFFFSHINYLEDDVDVGSKRTFNVIKEIDFADADIQIESDDGMHWSSSLLTMFGDGLGVYSFKGDSIFRSGAKMIDQHESISFDLGDGAGLGDALEVEFDFASARGRGQVELVFYDDGALVDEVLLSVEDGGVSYALADGQDFDRVEIGVTNRLKLTIDAVEFVRLEADDVFS